MCLCYFKNIVKSRYKEIHLHTYLENDKPNHKSFNIISYDRIYYTDIHFGSNIIKGFKWNILLWCFCLIFLLLFLITTSLRVEFLYIFWSNEFPRKGHTPRKICYIGKGLAISRVTENLSRNCQQFTNSHEDKIITKSRPQDCNLLHTCSNENKRNSKYRWDLDSRKLLNLIFIALKQIIWGRGGGCHLYFKYILCNIPSNWIFMVHLPILCDPI